MENTEYAGVIKEDFTHRVVMITFCTQVLLWTS